MACNVASVGHYRRGEDGLMSKVIVEMSNEEYNQYCEFRNHEKELEQMEIKYVWVSVVSSIAGVIVTLLVQRLVA